MSKNIIFLSVTLLLVIAAKSQKAGDISINTKYPSAGKEISFVYSGEMSKDSSVNTTLYYVVDESIYAKEIPSILENGKIKGKVTLPKIANAFGLRFSRGASIEKSEKTGLIYQLYKDKNPVPGTYAASAFLNNSAAYYLGIEGNFQESMELFNKEFILHPGLKKKWIVSYLYAISGAGKQEEANALANTAFNDSLERGAREQSLYALATAMPYNGKYTDSMNKVMIKLFPKGKNAATAELEKLAKFNDADSAALALGKLLSKFSSVDFRVYDLPYYYLSIVYMQLANAYKKTGDLKKYEDYINLTRQDFKWRLYMDAARDANNENLDDEAAKFMKKCIAAFEDWKKTKPVAFTNREWEVEIQDRYPQIAHIYAAILYKKGEVKEALAYERQALPGMEGSMEMKESLVTYLQETGNYDEATSIIERFIKEGRCSEKLKEELKNIYRIKKGTNDGFENYLTTLVEEASSKAREEMRKKMVKETPVEFNLKTTKGENISLQSLKGKVVVLDFWATWCGPCVASFPVMQRAERKYKTDTNVVFLFVNTSEFGSEEKRIKDIQELLSTQNFDFTILLDERKTSTDYIIAKDYAIEGLPTKIILDANGNTRFRVIGFNGDEENVEREITAMIELAKSES